MSGLFLYKMKLMNMMNTISTPLKLSYRATIFLFVAFLMINTLFTIKAQVEEPGYITLQGEVLDETNNNPVEFASLVITTLNQGTVTNSEGEFVLKVPLGFTDQNILVDHMGYQPKKLSISDLSTQESVTIRLLPATVAIKELTVRPEDPLSLIDAALARIPENYGENPVHLTGFYRETVKLNRKYVSVTEALVNIYKAAYTPGYRQDRLKVFKGKRSQDVEDMDTILVKLQGGPYTTILLDVVKNPADLFSMEIRDYYNFTVEDIVMAQDEQTYVVAFDQKPGVEYPLYSGKVYINAVSLAISQVEFQVSEQGMPYAKDFLVKKKPLFMKVEPMRTLYLVKYKEFEGRWFVNYLRSEADFRIKWNRRLFNTRVYTMSEMAITNRDTLNVERYRYVESFKEGDIFAEQVILYQDPDFWGEYNYIKPEESIEEAVERISEKLRKQEQE